MESLLASFANHTKQSPDAHPTELAHKWLAAHCSLVHHSLVYDKIAPCEYPITNLRAKAPVFALYRNPSIDPQAYVDLMKRGLEHVEQHIEAGPSFARFRNEFFPETKEAWEKKCVWKPVAAYLALNWKNSSSDFYSTIEAILKEDDPHMQNDLDAVPDIYGRLRQFDPQPVTVNEIATLIKHVQCGVCKKDVEKKKRKEKQKQKKPAAEPELEPAKEAIPIDWQSLPGIEEYRKSALLNPLVAHSRLGKQLLLATLGAPIDPAILAPNQSKYGTVDHVDWAAIRPILAAAFPELDVDLVKEKGKGFELVAPKLYKAIVEHGGATGNK